MIFHFLKCVSAMSKCEYIIVKLSGPVSGLNKVMNWKLNAFKKQQKKIYDPGITSKALFLVHY